ncbi:MAG: TolC family protein [Panacagrimonas sp.]
MIRPKAAQRHQQGGLPWTSLIRMTLFAACAWLGGVNGLAAADEAQTRPEDAAYVPEEGENADAAEDSEPLATDASAADPDEGQDALVELIIDEKRQESLSYSEALAIVWKGNPQVRQAELGLRASGYEVSGSRTGYFPFVAVQQEQNEDGDSSGLVRIVQPLWNGGLTSAQVDTAKAGQMAAQAQLNQIRLDLGLRTNEAYFNLVAAEELGKQWNDYVLELERLLGIIQRRADEGVAPRADVETVRTRLSQARAGREANRAVLESARAQLATLLNTPPGEVAWPADRHLLTKDEAVGAGTVGIEAHPARQLALAEVKRQEATARASKAQIWPQLNAEYRKALEDFSTDSGNDDTALLTFNYQTDSGLRGYRQYQAEAERANSAKASFEAAARDVEAQIRTARAERAVALIQQTVQDDAVRSSRLLVESFLRQFDVGRKTWLEVLNTLREYNETVLQSVSVRRNLWESNGRLGLQALYWRRLSDAAPNIEAYSAR